MAPATLAINDDEIGVDPLCAVIRSLSQDLLHELELVKILLTPDLFRIGKTHEQICENAPVWPYLQHLKVTEGLLAPNGEWHYTDDPDDVEPARGTPIDVRSEQSDDDDSNASEDSADREEQDLVMNGQRPWHGWRTRSNASFEVFLLDFANAASRRYMPNLESACLDFGLEQADTVWIKARWMEAGQAIIHAPGSVALEEDDMAVSRLTFWVGMHCTGWDVPAQFVRKWEDDGVRVTVGTWPVRKRKTTPKLHNEIDTHPGVGLTYT